MFWIYFLKLSLAHIIERFVLKPRIHALDSQPSLVLHGCFALLKILIVTVLLAPEFRWPMIPTIALYGAIGGGLERLEELSQQPTWAAFLWAQVGALATCFAIAEWWVAGGSSQTINATIVSLLSSHRVLWTSAIYLSVIFGGEQLTRRVAQHFSEQFPAELAAKKPGLQDAGKYIGWLERLLIVTFVVSEYGEAVGFVLAAKALIRYPEIKDDKQGLFGEYVLVGTLTSVGIALLGGVILRRALT